MGEVLLKRIRRKRILARAERLSPTKRAQLFRMLIYRGEGDRRLLTALVDLALVDNAEDRALPRYAAALHAGRRIKVGHYPVKFSTYPGIDPITLDEIERVLEGVSDADSD